MFNILNAIFQIKEIEAPAGSENLKRFAKISIPLDYPPCDYPISIKVNIVDQYRMLRRKHLM